MTRATASRSQLTRDLVIAVMAVNAWSLEKCDGFSAGLEAQGLFDFEALAEGGFEAHSDVRGRLIAAGYARGEYVTGLIAERLVALAKALAGGGLDELLALEKKGEHEAIRDRLMPIFGIGPAVLANLATLRQW